MEHSIGISSIQKSALPASIPVTKIQVPRNHFEVYPRLQVYDLLSYGLQKKVTLISAPAGFGKTTTVVQWLFNNQLPVSWVSIDQQDNDSKRFWLTVIAAFRVNEPNFGEQLSRALSLDSVTPVETILSLLLDELENTFEQIILVLDDYHLIEETSSIHHELSYFLQHLPDMVHPIITSRTSIPVHASLSKQKVETKDLRFTEKEFESYFQKINLSPDELASLSKQLEGWVTGMQLVALSLKKGGEFTNVSRQTKDKKHIFKYLAEEVLRNQPEDVQHFLLSTSILERLNPYICNAVTGMNNSGEVLERLRKNNTFLFSLDSDNQWYHYHQLFADFLQDKLVRKNEQLKSELHYKASRWLSENGCITEAAEHALQSTDLNYKADLIEFLASDLLKQGNWKKLKKWMEKLPKIVFHGRAKLFLAYLWVLAFSGNRGEVEAISMELETTVPDFQSSGGYSSSEFIGEVYMVRAYVSFLHNELERPFEFLNQSLKRLPGGSKLLKKGIDFNPGELFLVRGKLGMNGRLKRAFKFYERAETGFSHIKISDGHGFEVEGELYYEWNEFELALAQLKTALDRGLSEKNCGVIVPTYITMSRIFEADGARHRSLQMITEAKSMARPMDDPQWMVLIQAYEIRLAIRHGEKDKVAEWVEKNRFRNVTAINLSREFEYLTYVRTLIFLGKETDVFPLLNRLFFMAEQEDRIGTMIEILILKGLVYQHGGKTSKALSALEQALEIAKPEAYVRIFVDEGTPLAELLYALRRKENMDIQLINYVDQLLLAFYKEPNGQDLKKQIRSSANALTEREIEVLKLLNKGWTNKDIAEALVVTVGTLKVHLFNIYKKLNVKNRGQAVVRAREWEILKKQN